MGNDIEKYSEDIFENIKHENEYNQEFWYARELQQVLTYSQWRYFLEVIAKAKDACESSGNIVDDHFAEVRKMVSIGSGAEREVEDFMLTRYKLRRKTHTLACGMKADFSMQNYISIT